MTSVSNAKAGIVPVGLATEAGAVRLGVAPLRRRARASQTSRTNLFLPFLERSSVRTSNRKSGLVVRGKSTLRVVCADLLTDDIENGLPSGVGAALRVAKLRDDGVDLALKVGLGGQRAQQLPQRVCRLPRWSIHILSCGGRKPPRRGAQY